MEIKLASEVLSSYGYELPTLNALIPNEENYKVFLMQPHGEIQADKSGVKNKNRTRAFLQFGIFLEEATKNFSDLVMTPEYATPWETLQEAIQKGHKPKNGKLWALGCESIRLQDLEKLKEEMVSVAKVIYEDIDSEDLQKNKFVSPLAYVFLAKEKYNTAKEQLIVLIQFKTHPMVDEDHFENDGMYKGKFVYNFEKEKKLKLITLICADALVFKDDHAEKMNDRALILHIQLNKNPRHSSFCDCRKKLLGFMNDEIEIICLNWAQKINLFYNKDNIEWKNIGGSAWYTKSKELDIEDEIQIKNHNNGLYYTRLEKLLTHALFFNYQQATYLLEASKVAHINVKAPSVKRRGPKLDKIFMWDELNNQWIEKECIDDNFLEIYREYDDDKIDLKKIKDNNPFHLERILDLSSGDVENDQEWYKVSKLTCCRINPDEVIKRVTFAQDPDGENFRSSRLKRINFLYNILTNKNLISSSLADLSDGFTFCWDQKYPHQNIKSFDGIPATVIYMGEESCSEKLTNAKNRIKKLINPNSIGSDVEIKEIERLCVYYRRQNGEIAIHGPYSEVNIAKVHMSTTDIGRDE
ncbi:MAG: hypothetical protein H7832_15030 [Magnetococcus sp. DMHC-6]